MKYNILIGLALLFSQTITAQTVFTSLVEVLEFAERTNLDLVANKIKLANAEKLEKVAKFGIVDPIISLPLSYTNNTTVPVNLFPAEIFGGTPGTFTEVQAGVQYTANATQTLELQLYNPAGWTDYKLSKLNVELSRNHNEITKQQLKLNLADSYYNIINLQTQMASTNENLRVADSLLVLTENLYQAGLIRQQELNNAEVNRLTTLQSLQQLEYLLEDGYLFLKTLCNLPFSTSIIIEENKQKATINEPETTEARLNPVALKNNILQKEYASLNLKKKQKILSAYLVFCGRKYLSGKWQ